MSKESEKSDKSTNFENEAITSNGYDDEAIESFDDMDLPESLLRGIFSKGFETPTAIQQRGIKAIMSGRDLIAQAQSGTGKTGTFAIGSLAKIDPKLHYCQTLILAPTRELAKQTNLEVRALAEYMAVTSHACIGGKSVRDDLRILNRGANIVSGTPGRIYDMIQRGALQLHKVNRFILDEADEMLSGLFKEQIYDILQFLPEGVQICLFSATLPLHVLDLTNRFMHDPLRILVKDGELTLAGIKQFYVALEREEWKFDCLVDLYETVTITQAVIFCNTRERAVSLESAMESQDFTVSCIHGEMNQQERDSVMRDFRLGISRVLIATDLLARGIDVQQVSLVLNFDLPTDRENYIHRIGRAGRHGRKGIAINFVTDRDIRYLRDIEIFYRTEILEMPKDFEDLI
mmetsp:Transcript_18975/g.22806  ORF Transcript_18975/g.22806 Transcript_18975/m.22806 type:complete len:404 (-) Transcript_18975:98-1309(-)|eukprot:CAMPEP_0195261118 /NCGR_PEP_ID=MMETSP0706-20130129/8967_1 /TAXON_ID=33640 /ORGANISM="Asterionellopsis glacialis, Strain CCMP134" /LENGTH=403 /DNA_ID=CAMNT_0040314943 /DNA_START=236 /DNA_END=1447 /DNA_ORIENTATION=+